MADDLPAVGVLEPKAMVPPRPDLAAEVEPASWKEGEHLNPHRRAVFVAAGRAWPALGRNYLRGECYAGPDPTLTISELGDTMANLGSIFF